MVQISKILTKGEKEKKDTKKKVIISIVLAVIMLFSTAGYAFFSNDESTTKTKKVTYGGLEFQGTDYGTWKFQAGNYNFETTFNPEETNNISVSISKTLSDYYEKPIYFGINNRGDISTTGNNEIWRNMYSFLERSDLSCLDENCTEDKPIKNCSSNNVLIFRESNESFVREEESCIFLYSPIYEQGRVADAFLFKLLGI